MKCLWLLVVLALVSVASHAQSAADRALADSVQKRIDANAAAAATVSANATAHQQAVMDAQGASLKELSAQVDKRSLAIMREEFKQHSPTGGAPDDEKGERILMFASKAMPSGEMRSLVEAALADSRIRIVFLGGEPEGGVGALMRFVLEASKGFDRLPIMEIDPPKFHKYKIDLVPAAVVLKDGQEVARVRGVFSTRWIDETLRTRTGDLGSYGQLYKPSEIDMEAYIKERVAAFDWQGFATRARDTFWEHQTTGNVPHADRRETYLIDPTVTITHDVQLPDGRYLAHAGDRVNPLKGRPFKTQMIVIDARDDAQRAFAREFLQKAGEVRVVVMSTSVPPVAAKGWDTWTEWQKDLGVPLYLYSKTFADRFRLTGTPSVIRGDGENLKVDQYKVDTNADPAP